MNTRAVLASRPAIDGLTQRENQVLRLIAKGLSTKQIATELGRSGNTVNHHVQSIYGKMDVNSRVAAAMKARDLGLV